jgi:hypothetical protein
MFEKAMIKSVGAYLQPGEELLNATIVQGKGLGKVALAGGVFASMAVANKRDKNGHGDGGEMKLSSKMGIAITTRRLLIFKAGGSMTLSAKELLSEVPIADVDTIEIGRGVVSKPITLRIRGQEVLMEAPRAAKTDLLVNALRQAKTAPAAA